MTAKEYLKRYKTINDSINCKLDEIEKLRELATRLSPTAMFDRSGNVSDKVGRSAARIVDLENEINSQIDDLIVTREEIVHTISQIDDERLKTLLMMRYINGDKWEKIAERLGYSVEHVTKRLHPRALSKICPYLSP